MIKCICIILISIWKVEGALTILPTYIIISCMPAAAQAAIIRSYHIMIYSRLGLAPLPNMASTTVNVRETYLKYKQVQVTVGVRRVDHVIPDSFFHRR
jgi:hypothetical protein